MSLSKTVYIPGASGIWFSRQVHWARICFVPRPPPGQFVLTHYCDAASKSWPAPRYCRSSQALLAFWCLPPRYLISIVLYCYWWLPGGLWSGSIQVLDLNSQELENLGSASIRGAQELKSLAVRFRTARLHARKKRAHHLLTERRAGFSKIYQSFHWLD